eukprot:12209964-Ditylum_brightwellii.AAC.1
MKKGIGVVSTARYHGKTWPPKELKYAQKEKAAFNDFYWTVDSYDTLIGRWMGNGMKTCRQIWGESGTALIDIPTLIDNYNFWMGGVDIGDQQISYYHSPNIILSII